jgi:hypothetical protein
MLHQNDEEGKELCFASDEHFADVHVLILRPTGVVWLASAQK